MHYYFFLYAQFHIPLYAGNKYCAFRGQRNKKIDIFGPNMIKHMGSNFSTMHLFAFSLPIKNILNPLKIADAFCLVQKYHKKTPKTKQTKKTHIHTDTHTQKFISNSNLVLSYYVFSWCYSPKSLFLV